MGDGSGNFFTLYNGAVWLADHDSGDCWQEKKSLEDFLLYSEADYAVLARIGRRIGKQD